MKNSDCKPLSLALTLVLVLASPLVSGLASDADQPITIEANTATYDESASVSVYTGNVISVQGSIRVYSDKLEVHLKGGEPEKLVFTGAPARFQQTPDGGGDDVVGSALTGEYYPQKNLLILRGGAVVRHGNATYSSEYIEYDIKNSLVRAGDKSSDAKRVHVILKPKAE